MNKNLCKTVLDLGGDLIPLIIPGSETGGTGLMNPSIFVKDNNLIVNIRHINYTLWHSEGEQRFNNKWGPLAYLHPENDIHLKTHNFIAFLDDELNITKYFKVNMALDVPEPMWEFHGLEDARLVHWGNKLYMSGVRRDTTPNGQGRIELSEIEIYDNEIKEISRVRIEPPGQPSYCEKNWMPILDMPYHYIKWSNPTQVIKVDPSSGISETVFLSHNTIPNLPDFRGGSQVINWMGLKMAIIHQVNLFKNKIGQKDASYDHRLLIWDNDWNILYISDAFKFMTGLIEFCCGMAIYNDNLIISFGFQDNSAYLLKIPKDKIEDVFNFTYENIIVNKTIKKNNININNKFKNFPIANCISFEDSIDRRQLLETQFKNLSLPMPKIHISSRYDDKNNIIEGRFFDQLTPWHLNVTAAHLRAIKHWYNTTSEEYGLFFEDDITLETLNYWNFTWDDFINSLPHTWQCIQLTRISDDLLDIKLRERKWNDWSAAAYILSRNYAKKLIDYYYPNKKFILDIKGTNLLPITENILFLHNGVYNIPLFSENPYVKTTYAEVSIQKDENEFNLHDKSSKFIIEWWKTNGKNINIKNICNNY